MSPSQTHTGSFVQPRPLIITVAVHALILLLLIFWRFSMPVQEVQLPEMGMEVNLGTSTTGSGTDQPMDMEDPAASVSDAQTAASAAASDADVQRTDDDDAPSISTPSQNNNRQQRPSNTASQRPSTATAATSSNSRTTQPERPRYVYPGSSGRGGNSAAANSPGTNEGIAGGTGDQGVPHGTPGATNYTGSPGTGTGGISYALSGRTMVAFPPKEAQFRSGGTVIVRVTVARDGSITNKNIKRSNNTELNSIALRKVQQVRFNASETAPEEQFGDITFVFKTRQ
jgi:TonB family protein